MSRKLNIPVFIMVVSAMVLAACAAEPVVETVVVTEQVIVTEVVVETVEVVVTEEVEVIVEATPVPGRCAPMSIDDVEMIKIGATVPQSAPGAVAGGLAMQNAINIAVSQINEGGGILGKEIDVVFYDTASLPERGTAGMEYLITQECVAGVVGEYHSSAGVAMKEVAHKYHIPIVFAETWNDRISGSGYAEVFRIAPASFMVAQADAEYIEKLGAEFVVIVSESTDYGVPAAESTTEKLAERGIESETYLADKGTLDYSAIITRIQAGPNPDVVLVLITGEDSYNFENQAIEQGLMPDEDTVCIANQVAIQPQFWEAVPEGNYCAFRKVGLVPSLANAVTKTFEEEYRKRVDIFPESFALEAYDSMMIMANAIEQAGSLDPDAIIAALEATDITLAQGRYHFPFNSQTAEPDFDCIEANKNENFGVLCNLKGEGVPEGTPMYMWHQWPDPAVLFLQYYEQGQSSDDAAVVYPEVYQTHGTFIIPYGTTP
ncbi:MAG: ABC transporter substrate-binding protein [Chloroflexi bacterium]|nr:ABC transporter substrate-binding protein [Chloroflexota bacterium]